MIIVDPIGERGLKGKPHPAKEGRVGHADISSPRLAPKDRERTWATRLQRKTPVKQSKIEWDTRLLVLHDYDLIDEVATRIGHFENDHSVTDFKGPYEGYQEAVAA